MEQSYESLRYINNSGLTLLDPEEGGNPEKFRNFMLNGSEGKEKAFYTLGTNLHFIFLEKLEPIVIQTLPSDTIKYIADEVIKSVEYQAKKSVVPIDLNIESYTDELLKAAREMGYQNKYKDETLKLDIVKKAKEYWNIVVNAKDTPIVNPQQQAMIANLRASLALRPQVAELLDTTPTKDVEYFTEFEVVWEEHYTGLKLKCKSKLDRVRLCHATKTFSIRDFKTTGKPLESFAKSFEQYRYYRQVKFYENAFADYLRQRGLEGYVPAQHYIIAAETAGSNRVRSFVVTSPYLFKGDREIQSLLERAAKHSSENQWVFSIEETQNKHFYLIPPSF